LRVIAGLLGISRSSAYYHKRGPSEWEIAVKHCIDMLHTDEPTWGSRQLCEQLKSKGFAIGRRKTRRFMREMGISVIWPKPNLSEPDKQHKVYPYLLRNALIIRPNQAWSIDITYIKMRHGFVYLTALIDWYSRCIVGWELHDSLEVDAVLRAVKKAFAVASPLILNSDQGSQFTSKEYIAYVEGWKTKISMDGVGRWADNIFIERWFRTLKYDEVYIKDYESMREARKSISDYIYRYNHVRLHSSLQYQTPASVYYPVLLGIAADGYQTAQS